MKTFLWGVVIYQALVGAAELAWVTTQNAQLASIAALPSVATLLDSAIPALAQAEGANTIEGGIDLAVAGGVYFFFLR
jgi:hypothetical protein